MGGEGYVEKAERKLYDEAGVFGTVVDKWIAMLGDVVTQGKRPSILD